MGFRVWGLGFRVWGLGFGVWGVGFRVGCWYYSNCSAEFGEVYNCWALGLLGEEIAYRKAESGFRV